MYIDGSEMVKQREAPKIPRRVGIKQKEPMVLI